MEDKLASKQDLQELEARLQHSVSHLESKVDYSLKEMKADLLQVESKLTIRMGTMLAASIAILTAIQKLA